jgi:hypothetical protein
VPVPLAPGRRRRRRRRRQAPWEEVKKEMVEQKGLTVTVADRIGEYVKLRGQPRELLDRYVRWHALDDCFASLRR